MTQPQPLSPAAQAVVDAWDALDMGELNGPQQLLALAHATVALQAAVDNAPAPHHHEEMAFHSGFWAGIEYIRSIATELEGQQ